MKILELKKVLAILKIFKFFSNISQLWPIFCKQFFLQKSNICPRCFHVSDTGMNICDLVLRLRKNVRKFTFPLLVKYESFAQSNAIVLRSA